MCKKGLNNLEVLKQAAGVPRRSGIFYGRCKGGEPAGQLKVASPHLGKVVRHVGGVRPGPGPLGNVYVRGGAVGRRHRDDTYGGQSAAGGSAGRVSFIPVCVAVAAARTALTMGPFAAASGAQTLRSAARGPRHGVTAATLVDAAVAT